LLCTQEKQENRQKMQVLQALSKLHAREKSAFHPFLTLPSCISGSGGNATKQEITHIHTKKFK